MGAAARLASDKKQLGNFAGQGRGKSGGVRVIYYWLREDHQIYMLVIYPKSRKDTLTDKETAALRELVKEL